jgi:hypothetical protein
MRRIAKINKPKVIPEKLPQRTRAPRGYVPAELFGKIAPLIFPF